MVYLINRMKAIFDDLLDKNLCPSKEKISTPLDDYGKLLIEEVIKSIF